MDIQEIRRKRLRLLIDKNYDGKQANFISETGANQGEISGILLGKRTFGERKARKLEKLAKIEPMWFDCDEEISMKEIPTVNELHAVASIVPIVGSAKLGDEGNYFVELEYPVGNGDGGIMYSTKDEHAYALRCIGDSMSPRIRHGEYVIAEPSREVVPGDEVVVKDKSGRVMVKIWQNTRDGMAYFASVNESYKPFGILIDQIDRMHYIAGIAKSALKVEG